MSRKGLSTDIIIKAAAEIISVKGFDKFSLRELADKLGVKAASLYNHINNLSELTSDIGRLTLRKMSEQLYEGLEGKSPQDMLTHIAIGYRKFAKENPELYKTIIKIPATGNLELLEEGQNIVHKMYQILRSYGLLEGEIVQFSRSIRSSMHGFITLEEAGFFRDEIDIDESYSKMIQSYITLLELKKIK
ncbi:TetR/AcrR family transcriptional regulator [Lachnospiraceae bacterium]|nr:TetR/AcrR family transcriptional regulator [Lachnospiraceae bacterium]